MCRYATRANGLDYDDLPYALIGKKLAELLGGKSRGKKKLDVMQKHSNFQGCFLEKGGNFLDHYCKADNNLRDVVHPKKPSFDCGNKEKHNNRVLLEAEPQIGKTGVYLSVISKLRKLIEGDIVEEDEEFDDLEDDETGEENETTSVKNDLNEEWQYPYHKNMKARVLPKETAEGKYCRIFGPYKYGDKPKRIVFSEDTVQRKKTLKRRSVISPYKSYTAEHNACPRCSITVGHQVVKVQVVGEESRVWIPNRERYRVVLNTLKVQDFGTCEIDTLAELPTEELEYKHNHLKSWIFTPSHGRAGNGNLNLTHSMVCPESNSFMSYVHVLVVRPGQFEEYCRIWGSSHVIVELPALVQEWYQGHEENCTAEAGKIGYARRFIQAFAEHHHLHTIFMLDDNMPYFYELVTCTKDDGKEYIARDADNQVSQNRVPLFRVLKHLESMFDSDGHSPMGMFEPHKYYTRLLTRGSYTGPPDKYGVIGIRKHNRYNTTRVVNPFKNTHVFSLCLINVRALQSEGIKYKPWQAWEDLDLNNECDDKGLYVVKYNRFKLVKRHLSTWQREGFPWNEGTRLEMGTNFTEEEVNILFRWVTSYARPGRCEVSWPTGKAICPHVNDLVQRVRKLCRAKHHFAAVYPDAKIVQNYLHNTPGLSKFENHVLILPVSACKEAKLTQLSAFRKEVVERHFEPPEGKGEIRFKVVTSHNINEFQLWMILLYIEGKIKEPNQQHCDSPFNLPIPVKGKTETTTDVHMDPNGTELNSDAVTPDSDTKDESHNDDGNYKTSLKLDPDSDVEDPSSPEITHVAKGNLTKDVVPMNNESQTTGDGNDEPMEISDDEGTEENPIALSDSESAEESTDFLDETKDGHSESQAIPVDNSPSPGGNADETQRIGDGDESQKTTGSSDDSESVPFDLKPSQSPKSILGSVPNIGLRDQNSETDEDRESPSLLQPGPSQTWAETADDQLSPSLLQPGPSQTWVESADDRGSPRLRQPGPPQTWAETADDRGSPSLLQPGPSQTWAQTDDDRGSPSLRQLGPSQTWVSRSESLPDVVLIHSVEKIEKKYFETVEATEKRKYSGMKEEIRSPSSDENHDSPIIIGSSGLSHSKPGGSKHFKEASKTSGTNLKSRRSKESTIGSNNSASSWSHSAKNNDEVTDAISSFVPREGSLTDDDLLLSLEQFKAHELKHVDHQEDVNSLQEVKSKKKDTYVEDRVAKMLVDETSPLILDDLEVFCSRTGYTKPLRPGYRVRKGEEQVQVKSGSSHKIISKGEIRDILDKHDVKESN